MKPTSILIVVDETELRMDIEEKLNDLGYSISGYSSSDTTAIQKAEKLHPDLVLMDIKLDGKIDGIDASKQIKNRLNIPVVFVTTPDDEISLKHSKSGDSFGCLFKPITNTTLHASIEITLNRHKIEIERKKTVEALRESQKNYRDLVEKAGISILIDDVEGNLVYFNKKLPELFGYTREEIKGQSIRSLVHPGDVEWVMKIHRQRIEGKTVPSRYEFRGIKKDGSVIFLELDAVALKKNGSITGSHSYIWDITERKKTELINSVIYEISKAINESSNLDTLYPGIHKSLWKIIDVTNFYIALYNKEKDTIRFTYFTDEYDDELEIKDAIHSDSLTAGVIKSKKSMLLDAELLGMKYTNPREEWGTQPRIWLGVPLMIKNEVIGVIAVQSYVNPNLYSKKDLELLEAVSEPIAFAIQRKKTEEEKKILEDQLQQAKRIEALGTLAGGIAHDFNNLLGAIMGYTELTLYDIHEKDPLRSNLERAMAAAHRAKEMVNQILAFSRKDREERVPMYISSIVKEAIKFLIPTLPCSIEIRQNIAAKWTVVMGDPTQIYRLIINLCTNAVQAMAEKGGIIKIHLTEKESKSVGPTGTCLKPGTYMHLTITDTGEGIDAEIIDRIFEPYFSTRKTSIGTGMGLAVVHGIVKRHDGDINVHSEPGKGTTVHVFLPTVSAERISEEKEKLTQPLQGGNERILLIDDERSLADVGKQMLEKLGYQVSSWTNSSKALGRFQKNPYQFDLVITDMTMPDMTGLQLSEKIKRIRPDIPVILCTGFSESINQENSSSYGISALIKKPYLKNDVARVIREVLDGQRIG